MAGKSENAMTTFLDPKNRIFWTGTNYTRRKLASSIAKDSRRTGKHDQISFEFLGYTFQPRSMGGGNRRAWTGFTPAVSRASMKVMRASLRASRLHLCISWGVEDLAVALAPRVRGWMRYYCRFRASAFQPLAEYID